MLSLIRLSVSHPLMCLAVALPFIAFANTGYGAKARSYTKTLKGVPELDAQAKAFEIQTAGIANAPECFPVHMKSTNKIGIMYLYCSDEAYAKDGESEKLTETFTVATDIARRYNFWRRIYSLWTKDQYVLHLSVWPEVVLQTFDGSQMGAKYGAVAREIRIKRVAKNERRLYKDLFRQMHRHRNYPEKFTPAMKRVAKSMQHITNPRKYAIAARALRLQRGQRTFIESGLMTAPKYLSAIRQNFRSQNIPEELSLIAFVESSFNLKAYSRVGASGVYQIMPATGKQYLKIYGGVDERNDPIKASLAAAKLFRLNYKILGHWPLAVTAYNHGAGGVKRGVKTVRSTNMGDLIKHYNGRAFKFASKNFYTSYLGVLATLKDANKIFPDVPHVLPMHYKEVRLTRATSIRTLRRKYNLSMSEIKAYNPDITRAKLRHQGTLPRRYTLKIPATKAETEFSAISPASLVPNS